MRILMMKDESEGVKGRDVAMDEYMPVHHSRKDQHESY